MLKSSHKMWTPFYRLDCKLLFTEEENGKKKFRISKWNLMFLIQLCERFDIHFESSWLKWRKMFFKKFGKMWTMSFVERRFDWLNRNCRYSQTKSCQKSRTVNCTFSKQFRKSNPLQFTCRAWTKTRFHFLGAYFGSHAHQHITTHCNNGCSAPLWYTTQCNLLL